MDNRGEDRKGFAEKRSFRKNDGERGERRFECSDNFKPRRFERDGERRDGERREFKKDGFRPRGGEGKGRPRGLGELLDLDNDILHLVMRRAQLVARMRHNGRLAPETEKTIRTAWESKAARMARDNRLSRDLFVLLQSIEPLSREEEEQGYFNLAPSSEAVDIRIPAPSDTVIGRLWLAVAAAAGQITKVVRMPLTDAVVSGVKALNQIGGQLWWEENGDVQSRGGKGLVRNLDKVIHIGDDAFNLWLVIALCAGMPSRLKLTGESSLRFVDLAPLRRFLPQMGVRLTNVIPSQDGLPIRLECSGMMPRELRLADDLPEDFIAAMVLASPFWETQCRLVLPEKDPRLLGQVLGVLSSCGARVMREGREIVVERGEFSVPAEPVVPMDAAIAATVLMFPGFNGGQAVLEGVWGHSKAHGLVEKMLRGAGLNVKYGSGETVCSGKERETSVPAAEVMAEIIAHCPQLLPLASVIMAAAVHEGASVVLPELAEEERHLVTAFLVRCGVDEEDGRLKVSDAVIPGTWVAPSAQWAMAYALCAFLRPNLHLSNPGVLTALFPPFWNMYNTLPHPVLKRRAEKEADDEEKPVRRRVIAQGVYGELPPDTPAGEDS
ncbi:hypothetical protein [Mailhella sp.]|uniref:hypothetical protein n=1 Tax=Mailhella sp. TaxID=1981029 RepID=UPI0040638679